MIADAAAANVRNNNVTPLLPSLLVVFITSADGEQEGHFARCCGAIIFSFDTAISSVSTTLHLIECNYNIINICCEYYQQRVISFIKQERLTLT